MQRKGERDESDIKPYKNNPRKNDEAAKSVSESIKKFGFKNPIIVDEKNVVICGHTRLKAAKLLGLKKVPCVVATDLTSEQVKAYRLVDNRTGEIADWDFDKLTEELKNITTINMEDLGFSRFEINMGEESEPMEFDSGFINVFSRGEDNQLQRYRVIITYDKDDIGRVSKFLGIPAEKLSNGVVFDFNKDITNA